MSNDTQTLTLSEFLLARLGENEATAKSATKAPWVAAPYMPEQTDPSFREYYDSIADDAPVYELSGPEVRADDTWPIWKREDAVHVARHDPTHVLGEVASLRAIVETHHGAHECAAANPNGLAGWFEADECPTLRHLAAVYASHEDYRTEWRP